MEYFAKPIKIEYERWCQKLDDPDPYESGTTIGINDVLKAHFIIADYFYKEDEGLGGVGPKDFNILHSTMYRQFAGFGYATKSPSNFDICATLFFGIIKNHSFHDANKRTALLVVIYHLQKIGRCISAPQKDFENLAVEVASNKLKKYPRYRSYKKKKKENPEILFIADFLKRKSRSIDKRFYSVTFHQLKTILKKHNFSLENPHHNTIDIIKIEQRKTLFGLGKKKEHENKIGQIGFPGWKTQVGKGAINTVRKVTKLLPENGYDSQTFFYGADIMQALVDKYKGPLLRLADK